MTPSNASRRDLLKASILVTADATALSLLGGCKHLPPQQNPAFRSFTIGWYDRAFQVNFTSPALLKNIPCDIILPYHRGAEPLSDLIGYLDSVRAAGLKAFVELAPLNKSPSLVGGNFDPDELKQFINKLKDRPEIWGWYLYDEPPGPDQISIAKAREAYQLIQQQDGQRPVAVVVSKDISLEFAALYRSAVDIFMFDDYPLDRPEGFNQDEYFLRLENHSHLSMGAMPYWPVVQAAGTVPQFRYMVYAAVQSGGRGIFFYRYDNIKTDTTWLNGVYVPVTTELRKYGTAFARGPLLDKPYVRVAKDSQVIGTLYDQYPRDKYLLLLIHHGSGVVKTKVMFDSALKINSLGIPNTGQTITVDDNAVMVELGDYEAKIFQIENVSP